MILMLLFYSNNLLANNNSVSSTGRLVNTDTIVTIKDSTIITIPLYYIRLANAKLIERKYLLDIINEKDSIIFFKDDYIKEQNNIIHDINIKNNELNNNLNKQVQKTKIITYGSCGIIIGLILGLVL